MTLTLAANVDRALALSASTMRAARKQWAKHVLRIIGEHALDLCGGMSALHEEERKGVIAPSQRICVSLGVC